MREKKLRAHEWKRPFQRGETCVRHRVSKEPDGLGNAEQFSIASSYNNSKKLANDAKEREFMIMFNKHYHVRVS